jgi:putative FmdB family regulatory protein
MPLREYVCQDCEAVYEVLSGVSSEVDTLSCPVCGSTRVEKAFSTFATKVVANPSAAPATSAPKRGGCCGGSCGCHH